MRWVLISLVLGGCTVDIVDVDPRVDYGDAPPYVPEGDPEVELGYYVEQLYRPLSDGDACPIIYGLQGGTWTMPAIRARGINTTVTIHCSLTTQGGEVLGVTDEESTRMYLAPDQWIEIQALPVPAAHAPPREFDPIDDVYGMNATLVCDVSDSEGRAASDSVTCVLEEG